MKNQGFEFTVDANVLRYTNLSWNVEVNLSTLENEIIDLPNDIVGPTNVDREGYPEGSLYLPEYVGVDRGLAISIDHLKGIDFSNLIFETETPPN